MMPYTLNELFDTFRVEKALAFHLIVGFPPIFEIPGLSDPKYELPSDGVATAFLYPAEGPALTFEDLKVLSEEIRNKCSEVKWGCGVVNSRGVAEYRFRQDEYDFNDFIFARGATIIIAFRLPNKRREIRIT